MNDDPVTYFALYRSEESGPSDDENGVSWICVGLFRDVVDAMAEARTQLVDGESSIMIELGVMPQAEWDALEEVPDDFTPAPIEERA